MNVSISYRKANPVSTQKNKGVNKLKRHPVKKIENRIQPNTLFIVICTTTLCLAQQSRVYELKLIPSTAPTSDRLENTF